MSIESERNILAETLAVVETKLATQEQWAEAWSMFNEGVRRLNRLAINDGITVKLQMRTLGWVPRGKAKKAKS